MSKATKDPLIFVENHEMLHENKDKYHKGLYYNGNWLFQYKNSPKTISISMCPFSFPFLKQRNL